MSDEKPAEPLAVDPEQVNPDEKTDAEKPESSFGEMLSQFEESHRKEPGAKQLEGTVISVSADVSVSGHWVQDGGRAAAHGVSRQRGEREGGR